ncbi:hypothetical protein BDQ17DRAFT_1420465 [Cyathus striatus]|nr:hypothetical protein BDQ17DRAFT_1420465 [Cyathus striatus]
MSNYTEIYNSGYQDCLLGVTSIMDLYVKPWIYGNIFAGMLYGAIVLIVIAYLRILVIHVKGKKLISAQERILSIYVAVAFVLSTLQIGGALQRTINGLYETNMDARIFTGRGSWLQNVCYMLTAWAVDMIMMWRFLIIYHDLKRTKWSIFVFSSVIQTASIVFEVVAMFQNIMLTTLIVGRLLLCRRRIRRVLGKCYGNEYTGVASMVVESQSLLGVAQVIMLVSLIETYSNIATYGLTFYQVTGQIQVLSPMILIYRVMQGKMYNSETIAQIAQLRIKNDDVSGSNSAA